MRDSNTDPHYSPDAPPPIVPDFDLMRTIGRGGFGTVWLARNQTTGHLRAVKVIPLRAGRANPAAREITSLTRLEANLGQQHPNLLNIHHVGRTDTHLFYVMDLADDVSGQSASDDPGYRPATLESRLENGPLPSDSCLDLARQLLSGLASLHAAGMVHRDVKPANCLFVGDQLKLADFGLLTEADPEVSQVGTRRYMPPDGRMDTRADVYAAGLVIYQMITGLPVEEFPRLGQLARTLAEDPTLAALLQLVLTACERDPAARFADARAMLTSLETSPHRGTGILPRRRRQNTKTIMAVGLIVLLGVAAGVGFWKSRPSHVTEGLVTVSFVTRPFEADVYLDGELLTQTNGEPYHTPCTIDGLPSGPHRITFQPPSGPSWDAEADFSRDQQIVSRRDDAK